MTCYFHFISLWTLFFFGPKVLVCVYFMYRCILGFFSCVVVGFLCDELRILSVRDVIRLPKIVGRENEQWFRGKCDQISRMKGFLPRSPKTKDTIQASFWENGVYYMSIQGRPRLACAVYTRFSINRDFLYTKIPYFICLCKLTRLIWIDTSHTCIEPRFSERGLFDQM